MTIDGPMRDGPGWLWRGDLPHGVTAGAVSEKREELASGLRRPLGCVWPETDHKRHPGALNLYVGDEDMTTAEQPPWPLAKRGAVDMFKPAAVRLRPARPGGHGHADVRSVIIGSIPRMGKTFLLRLLLLICALDVRCEIHAYDLKGTGDLAPAAAGGAPLPGRRRARGHRVPGDRRLPRAAQTRCAAARRSSATSPTSDPLRCPENKVTARAGHRPAPRPAPHRDRRWTSARSPSSTRSTARRSRRSATDLAKRGPALGMLHHAGHPAAGRQVHPAGHPRQRRAAVVPEGHRARSRTTWCSARPSTRPGIRATMFAFDDKGVLLLRRRGPAAADHARPEHRRAAPRS